MKKLHLTGQFKRDFKKFRRSPQKVVAFEQVVALILNESPLPEEYKQHPLKGNYKGCLECHIEDDYLLIWIDSDMIELVRIGSHAELF